MSSIFRPFVYVAGGRIWATYPLTQMVMPIVAWVTSGFVAPGVHLRSGRPFALVHELGGGTLAVGIGTIAAAAVGFPAGDASDAARGAAPQLTANATTQITLAVRDPGPCPFTLLTLPGGSL